MLAVGCLAAIVAASLNDRAIASGLVRELKLGILHHDTPDMWSGFQVENSQAAINIEAVLSPAVQFLGGTISPVIGASIATGGGTSNVYLDARWHYTFSNGVFFGVGIGGTVHDGQLNLDDVNRKALGSRLLFHIPAEIGYRFDNNNSVSLYFEHISNAGTADFNEGLDRIGIRYGYTF